MRCAGTSKAVPGQGARKLSRSAATKSLVLGLLALVLAPLVPASANASAAGTVVQNTAALSFEQGGASRTVSSNTVRITLAERLDVTVVADAPTRLATTPDQQTAVGFRVANTGNGAEAFTLAATATGEGASVLRIVADEDGNGIYDPAIDRQLTSLQLSLAASETAHLFVIVGGVQSGATVSLTATATTGTGEAGTVFAGKGQNGGDAVVGATRAAATAQTLLTAPSQDAGLFKSQSVAAPDGSTRAGAGAVITYTLEARFAGPAANVTITDTIPAGTAYVAGSLQLDGAPLTDAGRFDGSAIKVSLPEVGAAGTRTIRFQVTIL